MILLIEDHPRLSKNIAAFLTLERYMVDTARDGETGLEKARSSNVSLIILDRNLPLRDGMEICRILRDEGNAVPILMLTAQGDTKDRVEGLNAGADDYLSKPFAFEELLARIRSLLRRNAPQKAENFTVGELEIDLTAHRITKNGSEIFLAPKEFAIFAYLLRHRGRPQNRTEILEAVWGEEEAHELFESDTIEVHMAAIRRKVGKDSIETVRGVGYKII